MLVTPHSDQEFDAVEQHELRQNQASFQFRNQVAARPLRGEVLIVAGHGIKTNPQIIDVDYPNFKIVLLPNSSRIVSPLQLDAMLEFHATEH